jgi:lauroyl/myristoyl acyltransferase
MVHARTQVDTAWVTAYSGSAAGRPLVSLRDFGNAAIYSGLAPIAWTLSENALPGAAKNIAGLITPALKSKTVPDRYRRSILGPRVTGERAAEIQQATVAHLILERLYRLRRYRPGGWQPNYGINGGQHIEAALAGGRGTLLWVMPFRYSALVTKIAFAQEGWTVSHLSGLDHLAPSSRLACALLNQARTTIERRNLAEHLMIERDNGVQGRPTLDVLAERLRGNGMVSITVGKTGKQTRTVPLLNGRLPLAIEPVHLALKSGANMLPVFTIAERPGHFSITIGRPLDAGTAGNDEERIDAMLYDFADRLAPLAESRPGQFPWDRSTA